MRFLGRLAWSLISLLAVILAMLFATSNTQTVALRLWPLEGTFDLPVWMIVLGAAGAGALFGGGLVWLSLVGQRHATGGCSAGSARQNNAPSRPRNSLTLSRPTPHHRHLRPPFYHHANDPFFLSAGNTSQRQDLRHCQPGGL